MTHSTTSKPPTTSLKITGDTGEFTVFGVPLEGIHGEFELTVACPGDVFLKFSHLLAGVTRSIRKVRVSGNFTTTPFPEEGDDPGGYLQYTPDCEVLLEFYSIDEEMEARKRVLNTLK